MDHAERMARFAASDLYVVITQSFCGERSSLEVLDAVLAAGVRLVQFREKDGATRDLFVRAEAFRRRTQEADALLIIDDRLDIALGVGADGVHLGRSDLPIAAARAMAPDCIIGASIHTVEDALTAQNAGASYVNIGPIFATQTKTGTVDPLGPEAIDLIAPHLEIPFTCMGGIKPHNVDEVLSRGARHPAVVTAVTEQDDVEKAARDLRNMIRNYATA